VVAESKGIMKTTYNGKQYELLDLDNALAEFDKQKAKGIHKAIISVEGGCIVVDAVFRKESNGEE